MRSPGVLSRVLGIYGCVQKYGASNIDPTPGPLKRTPPPPIFGNSLLGLEIDGFLPGI